MLAQANGLRQKRLAEELAVNRPLSAARLPRYRELRTRVTSNGTIQVQNNTYGSWCGSSDLHLEVFYGGRCQLAVERLRGEGKHRVDYWHVIWSLVKKSWGFARYRYREALFPTALFRQAYEVLTAGLSERQAELEYLCRRSSGPAVIWL